LCAAEHGFSLHAATTAGAGDRAGREALCKYILRPPLAQARVELIAGDLVRLKLRALLLTSAGIERYLRWLGEPTDPPLLAPSRGPPFFKSPVIRRRLGEPVQAELFDAH
jgi:hypothetical protein